MEITQAAILHALEPKIILFRQSAVPHAELRFLSPEFYHPRFEVTAALDAPAGSYWQRPFHLWMCWV